MLDKTYENCIHLIKRPISFDLDNRVSGRPRIEKKKEKKKVHCWSQVGDISLDFCTRNVSEKNVVTYENRSEGDLLHVRVELSFSDTATLTCYKSG